MTLLYPITTEKAVGMIERENKIIFMVEKSATKAQIKKEVEAEFEVKVESVNTLITLDGKKKAFVKLKPGFSADEVAAKLKIA
ncbi:50S ribosomal protein L23 [Candidatus Burarchaeum australiense]|nr:50S ribosomal protein L23 [Candidatus Burarchaeum australiense]